MLSTTNDATRQRAIEAVFRSKIRADLFIETLISETLESYIAVSAKWINRKHVVFVAKKNWTFYFYIWNLWTSKNWTFFEQLNFAGHKVHPF